MGNQPFWVATLTRNKRNSGTKDSISLVINHEGKDVVNRYIDLGLSEDSPTPSKGETNVYWTWGGDKEKDVKPEDDFYVRIGIGGSDLWRPEHIVIWTAVMANGNHKMVPIAIETEIGSTLSTDEDEGFSSIPIRRVAQGDEDTEIRRLLCVIRTGYDGTDSNVHLRIVREGELVVDHTFPDTPQSDFEADGNNLYFVPVVKPFIRRGLDDKSILLSIQGTDAWKLSGVTIFGVDTDEGRPEKLIPLVNYIFGDANAPTLSTDSSEGKESVHLPLSPT